MGERGVMPLAFILSRTAINSSQCPAPCRQLRRAPFVDPHPVGGMHVDRGGDPFAVILREVLQRRRHDLVPAFGRATSPRSPTTPCLAQSVMSKPSVCTAVGGSPGLTRARSAVIAASPPPPATGMSFQVMPLASRSFFSTSSAAASPPEVHQCSTSTSSALAAVAVRQGPGRRRRAAGPVWFSSCRSSHMDALIWSSGGTHWIGIRYRLIYPWRAVGRNGKGLFPLYPPA